jgi:hypothetical protein
MGLGYSAEQNDVGQALEDSDVSLLKTLSGRIRIEKGDAFWEELVSLTTDLR